MKLSYEWKTVTGDVYQEQLREVMAKFALKFPKMKKNGGPLLLQDNTRPHVAKKSITATVSLGFELLTNPPYSPDLAPSD